MTIQIKHAFTSAKGDGGDATLVRPSNWNATHTTSMASGNILGRTTAGAGSFEELPATAYMIAALNAADKAALVAALGVGVFEPGDIKFSANPTAYDGWIAYNGEGTISKAAAGGTVRANADCLELWKILYVHISDTFCPVSGGRTGSDWSDAANDFNAGKTMGLPRFSGRAVIGAGTGATLTARAAGAYGGAENATLVTANLPPYTPGGTITNGSISISFSGGVYGGTTTYSNFGNFDGLPAPLGFSAIAATATQGSSTFTGTAQGGTSTPVSLMQPYVPMWVKVKL